MVDLISFDSIYFALPFISANVSSVYRIIEFRDRLPRVGFFTYLPILCAAGHIYLGNTVPTSFTSGDYASGKGLGTDILINSSISNAEILSPENATAY